MRYLAVALLGCLLTPLSTIAAQHIIWQIGRPDRSYAEFAFAENWNAYAEQMGNKPIVFEMGRSNPSRDWPFIQPGPSDPWAGSRVHPRMIRFTLGDAPRGVFRLRIELVDTNSFTAPRYTASINGRAGSFQLSPGKTDAVLGDPRAGTHPKLELVLPAEFFHQGTNEITLAVTRGSWVLYDAITLLNDANEQMPPTGVEAVAADATPYFINRDGQVRRTVNVRVTLTAPAAELLLRVEAAGQSFDIPVKQQPPCFNVISQEVGVPDSAVPTDVRVTAVLGKTSKTATVHVMPSRKWRVYVFHASHCDPGWHDLPIKIMELHARYLDKLVDLCDRTAHEPPERQFVFTYEHSWPFDYYERTRPREKFERLMAVCRRGQIEVNALYAGIHTDLCGHEELARLTSYAAGLRKRYGIRVDGALLDDVAEGYTMGLPQVLARSGIRGICFGPGVKAIIRGLQPDLPRLFYWATPDGSRVLAGWTPGYWTYAGSSAAGYNGMATIRDFEAMGKAYPYDAIFRHGGYGDNGAPGEEMRDRVLGYRQGWAYPDVRMARVGDFVDHILSRYSRDLPTFQGDNPNSWADGTISLARETGMHRRSQAGIIEAEKLAALAAATGRQAAYPAQAIRDVYRDLHLYSEHTWGLNVAGEPTMDVRSPKYAEWQKNWDAKRAYPAQAEELVERLRATSLEALNARITTAAPAIIVWNSSSWPRTDVVRMAWDNRLGDQFTLVDARSGREAAWQKTTDDAGKPQLLFVADNVPALGYAAFVVESRGAASTSDIPRVDGNSLENAFYRVIVDAKTGGVTSIFDKQLQRELVDAKADWPVNQYIHAHVDQGYRGKAGTAEVAGTVDGDGVRYLPDRVGSIRTVAGAICAAAQVEAKVTGGPAPATVKRRVTLYRGLKFVEFRNFVDKKASPCKEQIYFAFPFAVSGKVTTHVELPYALMRWDRDILPGCWRGYCTAQHWVDVSGDGYGISFSPLEAPVVSIGGINSNQWDLNWNRTYVPANGHVFSYVMSNVWNCNYALWQGGPMTFAYRVTSHKGPCDASAAARFGWGHAAPLRAAMVDKQRGTLPAGQWSAVTVDAPNVILSVVKRAEDGDGWIVRLYETRRLPSTTAVVTLNFITPSSAQLTNLVEEPSENLLLSGNSFRVSLKSNELVTIRVK
jgi:hypothetical protein